MAGTSPRGGLGWTCPPNFCQRSFLPEIDANPVSFYSGVGDWRSVMVWAPKAKRFPASGGGLCPWTPLGSPPPDPIIGSRSARSPYVSTPPLLTWRRPCAVVPHGAVRCRLPRCWCRVAPECGAAMPCNKYGNASGVTSSTYGAARRRTSTCLAERHRLRCE